MSKFIDKTCPEYNMPSMYTWHGNLLLYRKATELQHMIRDGLLTRRRDVTRAVRHLHKDMRKAGHGESTDTEPRTYVVFKIEQACAAVGMNWEYDR